MGFVCGIPGFIAAGLLWGTYIGKRVMVEVPPEFVIELDRGSYEQAEPSDGRRFGNDGEGDARRRPTEPS